MKTTEEKLSRSNNWKTFKSKISKYGYPLALSTVLLLSSCDKPSEVTKAAKAHDAAIENVKKAEQAIEDKKREIVEDKAELKEAEQKLIEAEAKEKVTRENLKEESDNL